MHIFILLLGNFLFDSDEEVLHVASQLRMSLSAILTNRSFIACLQVDNLITPSPFSFAIRAKIAVTFRKPMLEAIDAELFACLEVDEDVLS